MTVSDHMRALELAQRLRRRVAALASIAAALAVALAVTLVLLEVEPQSAVTTLLAHDSALPVTVAPSVSGRVAVCASSRHERES